MLKDRREWIIEQKQMTFKTPDDIKPFYDRFNVDTPMSPEEQAAKDAADEEEGGKKKGNKKDKGAKGKGKGKKKKGGDDDGKEQIVKIGPSEVVQRFDDHYNDFNDLWVARDEKDNYT